jgi:hypothetical protein
VSATCNESNLLAARLKALFGSPLELRHPLTHVGRKRGNLLTKAALERLKRLAQFGASVSGPMQAMPSLTVC